MPSFVSSKLQGDANRNNYELWKYQVLSLLERKGLVGFIDGEAPPPPSDGADYGAWRRTDWLMKGWILGTLSDDVALLQHVVNLDSARDVWLVLENGFSEDRIQEAETNFAEQASSSANTASVKLSGHRKWNNYASWKEKILGLLESQGLVGFIDGEAPPPPPNDIEWRRIDWLVKGWILGALSDDALKSVVNLDSARDVWLVLESNFSTDKAQLGNSHYYPPPSSPPQSNYPPPPPSTYPPPQSNYPVAPPPSNINPPLLPLSFNYPPPPPLPSNYPPLLPPSNYPPLPPPSSNYLPPPSNYPAPPSLFAPPPQLGSSINNVANLVSVKLSQLSDWNSYNLWRQEMIFLVQSRNLVGFLDVRAHPPPNNDPNYSAWRQSDGMVKGWILEALSHDLVGNYDHLVSARDMWSELENDFLTSNLTREEENEWHENLEFYKIAIRGDWAKAETILKQNPDAIRARAPFTLETPLHIAAGSDSDTSVSLVEKLVKLSDYPTLCMRDELGFNPLHVAARTGNTRAAEILINKLPDLLYALSKEDAVPLHLAAEAGHRETTELLMLHTRDDLPVNPFAGLSGFLLLGYFISAGFLDMALDLVNKYPNLARRRYVTNGTALNFLASSTFAVHTQLNLWERLVQSCIQLEMEYPHQQQSRDIENQDLDQPPWWSRQIQKSHCTVWKFISKLVPCVKRISKRKWMHEQGVRLAKSICIHMESLGYERASAIYIPAMLSAARVGNYEIVEVIVETFPQAIYSIDGSTQQTFLHWAVGNRCEKVFNLLYQTSNHRYHYSNRFDSLGNSILHVAAFLAPPYKLNLVSGAALQMQRELQWFKEVEKFVSPHIKEAHNDSGKTPAVIFTEEHEDLKAQGEKWMKDTANSCTIAAALIVTVVFAAAITVPGGNQSETGYPMMWGKSAFTIFAVSDAISLFTSTTSLLMFLSILTSRYAEEDFLYALPKRLSIGLVTLFLSILSMMAAFSSTVFLVFGRRNAWVLLPAAAMTCLPIWSFVWLQFPLLTTVISSTYFKGIFGKQSDLPFH